VDAALSLCLCIIVSRLYLVNITILSDGRPIRRSLRKKCIDVVRKAVNKLYALENLYEQTGNIEKQIAINLIENFERDTKDIIRTLKERFKINE
jgi:hypothetical protein